MSNRVALVLLSLVLLASMIDFWLTGLSGTLFLARKFADLVEYLAFWR